MRKPRDRPTGTAADRYSQECSERQNQEVELEEVEGKPDHLMAVTARMGTPDGAAADPWSPISPGAVHRTNPQSADSTKKMT